MTNTTQEELLPLPRGLDGALQSLAPHLAREIRDYMREYALQCIATLKAENERLAGERDRWREDSMRQAATINRLAAAADDRNKFDEIHNRVHQADIAAAQSQAAAIAGLLEEAREWIGEWCMEGDTPRQKCCPKGCEQNALWRKLDAALAAWKGHTK